MAHSMTAILPAVPNPRNGMHAIERRFLVMRRAPPDLAGAMRCAFAHVMASDACDGDGHDGDGQAAPDPDFRLPLLFEAGLAIAAEVDQEAIRAIDAGQGELAYHNRYHFSEATLAMGWLCGIARARGMITLHQAALGVVAMVGHDLGHDGSWNQTGELEALSAGAVAAIAASVGVGPDDQMALRGVVLATALNAVRENKIRAADRERAGHRQVGVDALHLIASEADVLTSLMPGLGCRLGHALAAEWAANPGTPPLDPSSFTGRVAFLRLHDYLSDASIELGLLRMHVSQVMAFRQLAVRCGLVAEAEAGAAILDRLPPRQAARIFTAAMLQTSSGKPPQVSAAGGLAGGLPSGLLDGVHRGLHLI